MAKTKTLGKGVFLTALMFCGLYLRVFSQSSVLLYKNDTLFDGEGIILLKECQVPIQLVGTRFSPEIEEVILAENILKDNYNSDFANEPWFRVIDVKKKYWKHNRQYLGYINTLGDKIIIIKLLNFKCKRKAERNFEGWRVNYFVGFGKYYEKNTRRFIVNISKDEVSLGT